MVFYLLCVGGAVLYMYRFVGTAEQVLASSQAAKAAEASIIDSAEASAHDGADTSLRKQHDSMLTRNDNRGGIQYGGGTSPGLGMREQDEDDEGALATVAGRASGGRLRGGTEDERKRGEDGVATGLMQSSAFAELGGGAGHADEAGELQPLRSPPRRRVSSGTSGMLEAGNGHSLDASSVSRSTGSAHNNGAAASTKEEKARKLAILRGALQ